MPFIKRSGALFRAQTPEMALQYSFVSEPDENLKCCICLEVARYPKQEEEGGKLFCNDCLEEYELKTKGSLSCPHCKDSSSMILQ